MREIRTVIFDVGGVLLQYRWKYVLIDYGLSEEEAERVGRLMLDDPLWNELDLGVRTQDKIISDYLRKYKEDGKVMAWFLRHGEYMPVARPEIWDRVHELKKRGYGIYLLSNYSEDLFRKHTQYADFMNDIDGKIVSYAVHLVKPDHAIYEELVRRYNLTRENCIFFDDREENVAAAIECGIRAVRVTGRAMLAEALDKLLAGEEPA